jgi:uncharacterized membrane protein YhaH (DUF805 family)
MAATEGGAPAAARPEPARTARNVHLGLVILFIVGVFVQFYFAGRGAFGASTYSAHKDWGGILHLYSLLLLIVTIALPATRNRVDIGMAAGLFVLVTIQAAIGDIKHPELGAFHPVNALLIVGNSFGMLRRDREALTGRA